MSSGASCRRASLPCDNGGAEIAVRPSAMRVGLKCAENDRLGSQSYGFGWDHVFHDRGKRQKRHQRNNFASRISVRSGIGVFGERLLYHLGHFPVPLWAMYRTTLRKVLYHLGSNCYRFDCKHGILCIRPCETPLHMWYVPRFVTTEYITRFVTKIHPLRQFLR